MKEFARKQSTSFLSSTPRFVTCTVVWK